MSTFTETVDSAALAEFCRRWKIRRLELFGSVLDKGMEEAHDVDFLYEFEPDAKIGFEFVALCEELEELIGKPVDMISRRAVEESRNDIRRKAILSSTRLVYES